MSKTTPFIIDTEKDRLAHHSLWAIAGTLLSRASGVIRTLIVNATFGATTTLDAFNAAFRFPNSLRDLFADGALSAAFIKVLVDVAHEGDEAIRELISITSGFFLTITLLLSLLGMIFAKPFMTLISGNQFALRGGLDLATLLFQILVYYLPITMLNALVMGVLGVKGDMFRAMNGSIFVSIGMIAGALILAPIFHYLHYPSVTGLAIGAMLGVLLQFIYQAYPLKHWNLLVLPNLNPHHWWHYTPLRNMLLLMAPRAFGQGALVLALIANTYFALQIGKGALTYVATTVLIIQVPIGLFGVSTGFAALPLLSAAFNEAKGNHFYYLLKQSLATANWLSILTLSGFALLIVPLYLIFFQHGAITFHDTLQNCIAICAYGIGIFFATSGKVLLNVLYAINATRQIIYNSLAYLVVNVTLSALLTPHFGLVGLGISFATATAVDCWLNYLVVFLKIRRHFSADDNATHSFSIATFRFILLSLLSYAIGIVGVTLCFYFWPHFVTITGIPFNIGSALLIVVVGGSILLSGFILLCRFYGPEQLQNLINKILKKIIRRRKSE